MTKFILSFTLFLTSTLSFSQQDTIFFTNGSVLVGSMDKMTEDDVEFTAAKDVLFTVSQAHIASITLANQQKMTFNEKKSLGKKRSKKIKALSYPSNGKEYLFKNNGDTIECKIIEVNHELIRYQISNTQKDIFFSSNRKEIGEIVLSDGQLIDVNYGEVLNIFTAQKAKNLTLRKNAIKLNLVYLTRHNSTFEIDYERALKSGNTFETSFTRVRNRTNEYQVRGVNVSFGPKYYFNHKAPYHRFRGFYLKPELFLSVLDYKEFNSIEASVIGLTGSKTAYSDNIYSSYAGGLALGAGFQINIRNTVALDFRFSYGLAYIENDSDRETIYHDYRGSWMGSKGDDEIYSMYKGTIAIGFIR